MPFIEIAFQAEVSRFEDSEFEEYARTHCCEDPDTRSKKIEELRSMIYAIGHTANLFLFVISSNSSNWSQGGYLNFPYPPNVWYNKILVQTPHNKSKMPERGECRPRRIDDAYCLRFLRCRRFIPALAHRLMVRYEEFRRNSAHLYDCDAFGLRKVKHVYGGTFPESPKNGRIVLMRFGKWDVDAVPITDVVRCALLMDEIAVMQPKLQILGVTIIVDLEGLSLRHVRHLTPSIAHQIVSLMGVSFPLTMHGLHMVNYNWFLNTFFYLFKQCIPQAVWNMLHFHGTDMSSLHQHIDPQYLPPEYGGTSRHVITTEEWINKIDLYKDEFIIRELRDLGFTVKD